MGSGGGGQKHYTRKSKESSARARLNSIDMFEIELLEDDFYWSAICKTVFLEIINFDQIHSLSPTGFTCMYLTRTVFEYQWKTEWNVE